MIGFLATAYITFILIVIHYVVNDVPETARNPVDSLVLKIIRKTVNRGSHFSGRWAQASEKATLMFSDQQLITGIAILGGGYSKLRNGIQAYHWQIIVDLAWFASCTHLATMTTLRQYFRGRPVVRSWRVVSMLIMLLLLITALAPTGDGAWLFDDDMGGVPTICYFDKLVPAISAYSISGFSVSTFAMGISIFVLVLSYSTRAIKLFDGSSEFIKSWIRRKPSDRMRSWLDRLRSRSRRNRTGPFWLISHEALLITFLILRALMDLYESIFWEVSALLKTFASFEIIVISKVQCHLS